ncbi:MAG: GIY-YIG nuclease family protein [Gemmatimonadaceae bacterium]|nr:GIY-YIG nuclease family protein [Gemmatimonadaceae bacterium]
MSDQRRKALMHAYKETPRPAGIFRVRHLASGRSLVGATLDVRGMLNRQRFQLVHGSHPDIALQGDWDTFGASAFAFDVLDELKPQQEGEHDPATELRVLQALWAEQLAASEAPLYPSSWHGR